MAGVKGKSGGPRPNSGGARPGSGRKKKEHQPPAAIPDCDMLKMLQDVALGKVDASPLQVRAAIAAVQYTHAKKGDSGKKDDTAHAAKKAATGKFAAAAPPKLVASNGREV